MTPEQLWQATIGELEISLSKANFTTWFKHTFIASMENNRVIVHVPNAFTKTWLERKHHKALLASLQRLTNREVRELVFEVNTKGSFQPLSATWTPAVTAVPSSATSQAGINPRYTFDSFIVGKGNELANAAARAVVDNPGAAYNPLFFYGGVGLGKTHLVQAIGNEIKRKWPERKILYATCETFTNQFIDAVRTGKGKLFHDTYRSVDVLLIDDIQFISGKTETQEAFFHTFNDLYQANKQIVISSDRHPKAIPAVESRLISRFEAGMTADITPPDMETRLAILTSKCQEKRYSITPDILSFLASHIQNNVRELEGVLNKIIAFHQLKNIAPTLDFVKNLLASHQQGMKKNFTPKQILQTVAEFYDLKIPDLLGKSREKRLSHPRQIIMYILRDNLKSSFPMIGAELGGRDHTTAIHACEKIAREMELDPRVKYEVDMIRQRLCS